jgi:hypothetical protein
MSWLFRKFNEPKPGEGPLKRYLRSKLDEICRGDVGMWMVLVLLGALLFGLVMILLRR